MKYDFLIVGAGFAGVVCAQQFAEAGKKVLLIDKRPHIGGNAYDEIDSHGVMVHPYGPHIFHTNSKRIFEYLSRFTTWRFYEHRVLASLDGQLYPIPINRTTINRLYGLNLDEEGVREFYNDCREPRSEIKTSEDVVLNSVGFDLCEKFFRGYTKKQWGLDLSQLAAGVAARIPTRVNDDDRYFSDTYQFMPANGYTEMFNCMLDDDKIEIILGVDYSEIKNKHEFSHTIYTGPIDAYFEFCYGRLPYRSLNFEHMHFPTTKEYQATGTVNFPNENEFTRITEFKHLTGQIHHGTSIVREYPKDEGDPYYPIPRAENESLYKRYVELAKSEDRVTFVGRLAQYRYYNMDQVVGAAMSVAENLLGSTINNG